MVESDAGAGEGVLGGGGNAVGVAVGGDGGGATVIHFIEGGTYVFGDVMGIAASRHLAVLYVPPHRRLRLAVRLRLPHRHSHSLTCAFASPTFKLHTTIFCFPAHQTPNIYYTNLLSNLFTVL